MPPHERMSLTQQLLLRSLVARFWRTPYSPARLVRWGTQLHDRFMLPHFIAQDFADVIAEQECGRLSAAAPNGSRRMWNSASRSTVTSPRAASRSSCAQALEPWHVMGEEGAVGRDHTLCRLLA